MSILYELTVATFIRGFRDIKTILQKGEEYAKAKGIPVDEMAEWRLTEDMFPLSLQVSMMSNQAKFVCVRVAGMENESMEDQTKTLAEIYDRIDRTAAFLKKAKPEMFEGKENTMAHLDYGARGSTDIQALQYISDSALPNFWFHYTTAYDILRAKGVQIGKFDFLGPEVKERREKILQKAQQTQ